MTNVITLQRHRQVPWEWLLGAIHKPRGQIFDPLPTLWITKYGLCCKMLICFTPPPQLSTRRLWMSPYHQKSIYSIFCNGSNDKNFASYRNTVTQFCRDHLGRMEFCIIYPWVWYCFFLWVFIKIKDCLQRELMGFYLPQKFEIPVALLGETSGHLKNLLNFLT